jgi:hypothetical protein
MQTEGPKAVSALSLTSHWAKDFPARVNSGTLSLTCEAAARITKHLQSLLADLGAISGDSGGDEKIEDLCGSSRAIHVLSPDSLGRPAIRTRVWTPAGRF